MDYQSIYLSKPIKIIGVSKRIDNFSTASEKIGKLWEYFFRVQKNIPNKKDNIEIYSIYSNYDENNNYDVTVGVEVSSFDNLPDDFVKLIVPQGNYALYNLKGKLPDIIIDFWRRIWSNNLDYQRAFISDFEIYNFEKEDEKVKVFISKV